MDYSDYLRRKRGQAVYANYQAQESVNSSACLVSPTNLSCSSQIKPKSFADAYDIAQGSSTSGCGYSISENGVFSYVPKCALSEYTDITGSAITEFVSDGERGIYIIYSNDGTPLYSFLNTSYISGNVKPFSMQIGSLYTSTNYYTNMIQTLSNWEPASIQPINVPSRGVAYTTWTDSGVPLNTIVFAGEGPGGVYNRAVLRGSLSNNYFLNILDSPTMNIYNNGNITTTINNNFNKKSFVITVLNDSIGEVWSIQYPTSESLSANNSSSDNSIYEEFERDIKINLDTLNNMYLIYNHKMDCNNDIYQSDDTIASLTGTLVSNDYRGSQIIKYDNLGYATWVATAVTNYDGYTRFIRRISTDSIAIASRYYSNTYFSNSYSINGRPVFYNSNGSQNRPPLPATSSDLSQHFVATYSSNGNFGWASAMSCPSENQAMNNMRVTGSGSVYVCGRYESNNYFYNSNGTLSSISNVYTPYEAGYLARFNSNGTPQWALSFTVNYLPTDPLYTRVKTNTIEDIGLDSIGNIYAILGTGTCNARIYRNNTLVNNLSISNIDLTYTYSLVKINSDGQIQWTSAISDVNQEYFRGIIGDISFNLVAGGLSNTVGIGGVLRGDKLICRNAAGVIKLSNTTSL